MALPNKVLPGFSATLYCQAGATRPIPKKVKQQFHSQYGNLKGKEYKNAFCAFDDP